jgi:hypothetical protein
MTEVMRKKRKGAPLFARLPPDLRADLDAFVEVHFGATQQRVVCDALRKFIADQIAAADPAFREKFQQARNRFNGLAGEALRLVAKPGSGGAGAS